MQFNPTQLLGNHICSRQTSAPRRKDAEASQTSISNMLSQLFLAAEGSKIDEVTLTRGAAETSRDPTNLEERE